jgi:hypothetical protein
MAYKLGGTGSTTSSGTFSSMAQDKWKRLTSSGTRKKLSNFASGTKVYGPASATRNIIRNIGSAVSSAASFAASLGSKK